MENLDFKKGYFLERTASMPQLEHVTLSPTFKWRVLASLWSQPLHLICVPSTLRFFSRSIFLCV